ncbi:hypothetical protein PF006_g26080 [Phytophthora fragariae]|uniref:Reverse transcriptase RNase H-like domain-containing protein n=1 Tax=Phytophthora fragariae TaxID=53985 RepID=A0A6A3QZ44_9STRA|nr:hypothetical protein PF006_g26080 [Phytophthora fragariae]KAE9171602.1 hypothetical protein PF004_g27506 [Phytophthora fragariae]
MQDRGEGWQPVAYASTVNSTTEANYGITELECLAVVWAIKFFRPYIYGRRFTIITDHSALKWLMTGPNLTGKLHRWALTLQELDFDVQYRPGATNVVADALSRAPTTASVLAVIGKRRRARKRQAARMPATEAAETTNGTAGATGGTTEATSGTSEVADELKSGAAESSSDNAGGGRAARGQAIRQKHGTWASDVVGGDELVDQQAQATKQSGGDGRRRPVRDGPHAGDDAVDQVAQADKTTGPTEMAGARLTSDERARMPRMEALRRTPAESREVLRKTSDGAVITSGEKGAGGRQCETPKTKRTAAVPRGDGHDEQRRVGPILGGDGVETSGQDADMRLPKSSSENVAQRTGMQTLQLTDEDITAAQWKSRLVQRLLQAGEHKGMKVERRHGLVLITTAAGRRVVLPPELWPVVFKECHDSVWAGHLRAPHTHARIAQVYWWPALLQEVKQWVRGCQE